MDPVKAFLVGSVVLIFAILLWFAFIFPRLWLLTYFRVTRQRPSRRQLMTRLWRIEPEEMRHLTERLDENVRSQITRRLWIEQIALVLFALVVLFFAGGVTLIGWLLSKLR